MRIILNNEDTKNKTFFYEENVWTGKRTLVYYGTPLKKLSYGVYKYQKGDESQIFEVKGNSLIGLTVKMFGKDVRLIKPLAWYEITLSALIFVAFVLFGIWSGQWWVGAICGGLGGGTSVAYLYLAKKVEPLWLKILLGCLLIFIGFCLGYIFAFLIAKTPSPFI